MEKTQEPNEQKLSPEILVKKQNISKTLDNVKTTYGDHHDLNKFWIDELKKSFDTAIQVSGKYKKRTALVMQFADAYLHSPSDAEFASVFFEAFGAHANIEEKRIETDATSVTEIANDKSLATYYLKEDKYLGGVLDRLPQGSLMIYDSRGEKKDLIIETNIDGVRIIMDGSSITNPESSFKTLRPMLIVDLGKEPPPYHGELEKDDPRKSWSEIHKREPITTQNILTAQKEARRNLLSENENERMLAEAALAWVPSPKNGREIKVTPTTIKNNPAINKEKRLDAIKDAINIANNHLRDSQKGLAEPLVGATTYSLSIMLEALKMTPEEIMNDGEAISDLVEYLKQMSSRNPGIYGPSILQKPPPEGDPVYELALEIEDTWNIPDRELSPFMYQRVSWNRPPNPKSN